MIRTMEKALRYATAESENPLKIKEHVEEYLAAAGYDRRYKFKWKALSGNHRHTFSGIFEFAGQRYYFSKMLGKIELERI
jgi:hypothetical protein